MKELNKEYYDTSSPSTPYGGVNPYEYCNACERSMIEVSYDGHYEDCSWVLSKLTPISNILNLKELNKVASIIYEKISASDFELQDADHQDILKDMLNKIMDEIKNIEVNR